MSPSQYSTQGRRCPPCTPIPERPKPMRCPLLAAWVAGSFLLGFPGTSVTMTVTAVRVNACEHVCVCACVYACVCVCAHGPAGACVCVCVSRPSARIPAFQLCNFHCHHHISSLPPSQKAWVFYSFSSCNSVFSFPKARKNLEGQGERQTVFHLCRDTQCFSDFTSPQAHDWCPLGRGTQTCPRAVGGLRADLGALT